MRTGVHPGSSPGQAFAGKRSQFRCGRRFIRRHAKGFQADRNNGWRRFGWYRRWLRLKPIGAIADVAARQGLPGPTEPRDIDGGMVPGGLARQQIAPEFDRGLGLLDILEKGEFAVITAPAAGLEQLREMIQPLLGKSAPAPDNVATARRVQSMSHKPARKEKNGRGRNGNESIRRDTHILWKTFALSSERPYQSPFIEKKPPEFAGRPRY